MMRKHHEQKAIRRYLLDQLSDLKRQKIELRLLSDAAFNEELEYVEDEIIDEYIAGLLSSTERLSVEKTFLAHPERKRKLEAGQALKRYLDATSPPPKPICWLESLRKRVHQFFFSSRTGMAFALIVVVVAGLGIWRGFFYQSDLQKGLIALNEAYSEQRPTEARVSNLNYARFISRRRGELTPVNEIDRRRAERYLIDAFKDNRNADSNHALAQLYLLQGEPDKAIEHLEEARRADSNNARIYADLGAAYLEKGKAELENIQAEQPEGKGLGDLGRSLDYLKHALELDPNLLEALFNRALVHQHQKLLTLAKADWRTYLEKDPTSPWAAEAQQNLKKLEEQKSLGPEKSARPFETFMTAYRARDDDVAWDIYRREYSALGNAVTNKIVDNFLSNDLDQQSIENLRALNFLGQLAIRKSRDAYPSDLSKVYAKVSTKNRKLLAQARQQMVKGYELLGQSQISKANEQFAEALTTFESVDDFPESLAAQIAIAHGAVVQPNLPKARELLTRIIPICESNNYQRLLAQARFQNAHLQSNFNNYSKAIDEGNRALRIFKGLGDVNGLLASFNQLASLHLFLNDVEMSFSYLMRGLALTDAEGAQPSQLWGLHVALSLNLRALKLHRAALDYQNEALQLVLPIPKAALYHSRSYEFIGQTYADLRRFDLALYNLRLSYEQAKPLASEPNGQNMMASASLGLGDVYRAAGDPINALTAYEEGLKLYEALGFDQYKYAAHKGKFLSYWAQNNDVMAAHELKIVENLFDQYREKIISERQSNFFFDHEQDIYDLAIDFTFSELGDEFRAFDYSETSRARNLRDLMQHGAEVTENDTGVDLRLAKGTRSNDASLTASQVKDSLPEQLQMVQFAVLEKKLLIWHVTRFGIVTKSVPVNSFQLAELVEKTLKQITTRDSNNTNASLKALYEVVIEPIEDRLDPNRVVCFIPDKILHYVPFGALISPKNGHFLIQDFRVLVSPSATILIDSTNNARQRELFKREYLLAVGNPTIDRQANPTLRNLPEARREVEAIALNYKPHKVLVERQATRKEIIRELPKADVVHFAGHYEIDPRSNLLSRLVLAPDPDEPTHTQPSGLHAMDIYRLNLARVRLAVLAGCSTGIEKQFSGEGVIGFARSFLVAGVPVVVASLWPIDSDATAELMIDFHRYRKQHNLHTTEALMRAQQDMISRVNYRDPYYWAGFLVVGGHSEY